MVSGAWLAAASCRLDASIFFPGIAPNHPSHQESFGQPPRCGRGLSGRIASVASPQACGGARLLRLPRDPASPPENDRRRPWIARASRPTGGEAGGHDCHGHNCTRCLHLRDDTTTLHHYDNASLQATIVSLADNYYTSTRFHLARSERPPKQ